MYCNFATLLRLWVKAVSENLALFKKGKTLWEQQRKQFDYDYSMFFSFLHICQFPYKQIFCTKIQNLKSHQSTYKLHCVVWKAEATGLIHINFYVNIVANSRMAYQRK